eukprot:NODE_93_length_2585_cov_119.337145_g87_i0.p1 GENE.NODE_93_length_2585_cov_119.337145_g87_i0~~NODE_93_length_2585_cov_119.337145_g87_i0.p1  ORF type:complete len:651 (+),score=207.02 NODE_93_length_2585_cov_119.337145_g87_i0:458-2410(+)
MNALMGCEFLPSHNVPETARIVRVQHTDCGEGHLHDPATGCTRSGPDSIRETLRELNRQARESSDPPNAEMLLSAPFVSLEGKAFGQQRFDVLDTPGPNEAKSRILVEKVNNIMSRADVILYILDYTKLRTTEEEVMFASLRNLRVDICDTFHDRLFLVVNKMDTMNRHSLSAPATVEYIADLVTKDIPELLVVAERVLLVSAENALLSRQVMNGTASPEVKSDFVEKVYGMYRDPEDVTEEEMQRDAPKMLAESGFLEMEKNVLSFMFNNKARILIDSIVGDALRHLCTFNNYLITCLGALETDKNQEQLPKLRKDLDRVLKGFSTVKEAFELTKQRMEEWVMQSFHEFQQECHAFLEARLHSDEYNQVSRNKEDVTYIITENSNNLARELDNKFSVFRKMLEKEAFLKQEDLFQKLGSKIQPFMQKVEYEVGEFLNISDALYPVAVEFPRSDLECFLTDIDKEIETMITRAKGSLSYENPKRESGWCNWLTTRKKVSIPVELYTSDTNALVTYWKSRVSENTTQSASTAKFVISGKVNSALDTAQTYLEDYIRSYCDTIEYTMQTCNANEERRQHRLDHVRSLISDLKTDMRYLISINGFQNPGEWLKKLMKTIEVRDEDELGLSDDELLLHDESPVQREMPVGVVGW